MLPLRRLTGAELSRRVQAGDDEDLLLLSAREKRLDLLPGRFHESQWRKKALEWMYAGVNHLVSVGDLTVGAECAHSPIITIISLDPPPLLLILLTLHPLDALELSVLVDFCRKDEVALPIALAGHDPQRVIGDGSWQV